uniref:WGS project CAEQ00000000 data, annotated contig 583 n=1 Tax=Trypanosoma congolense (strain IL3000) TaxID=1068625 RepID=F9WH22_TRYCI|nr:unnamed protein product [Trypanosoma congolense IL3000]
MCTIFDDSVVGESFRPLRMTGQGDERELNGIDGPMARMEELLERGRDLIHGDFRRGTSDSSSISDAACNAKARVRKTRPSVLQRSNEKLQELVEMASVLGRRCTPDAKMSKRVSIQSNAPGIQSRRPTLERRGSRRVSDAKSMGEGCGGVEDREDTPLNELWDRVRRELEEFRQNGAPPNPASRRLSKRLSRDSGISKVRTAEVTRKPRSLIPGNYSPSGCKPRVRATKPMRASPVVVKKAPLSSARRPGRAAPWERLHALAAKRREVLLSREMEIKAHLARMFPHASVHQRYGMLRMSNVSPGQRRATLASTAATRSRQLRSTPEGRPPPESRTQTPHDREKIRCALRPPWVPAKARSALSRGSSHGSFPETSLSLSVSAVNEGGGDARSSPAPRNHRGSLRRVSAASGARLVPPRQLWGRRAVGSAAGGRVPRWNRPSVAVVDASTQTDPLALTDAVSTGEEKAHTDSPMPEKHEGSPTTASAEVCENGCSTPGEEEAMEEAEAKLSYRSREADGISRLEETEKFVV